MSGSLSMRAPSVRLLRAFLIPSPCSSCQTRASSNWMPRKKFANISSLDKLHRKQKKDLRQERLDSEIRAKSMRVPLYAANAGISSPDSSPSTLSAASPAAVSATTSTPSLPYSIQRTPSHELPVYQKTKSGGTKHITTLRKLSGDLMALQAHLRDALALKQFIIDRQGRKKENVSINWRTRHINVRGWRGPEIKQWAQMVGF